MNNYTSTLTPKQKEFLLDSLTQDTHINIATGAVRSGKSVVTALAFLIHVAGSKPGSQHAAIGHTKLTAYQNIVEILQNPDIMGSKWAKLVTGTKGAEQFYINGRRVNLFGGSNAASMSKLKGPTFQYMLIDEATTLTMDAFQMAISRLSAPGAKCWVTTNPDHSKHWLKTNYIDAEDPAVYHMSFGLRDNTHLEPNYVARTERLYTGNPTFYKRNILGEWVSGEGLVYPMFNENIHIITPDQLSNMKMSAIYSLGVDGGFQDATAAVLLGLSNEPQPRLIVLGEYRHDRVKGHSQMAPTQIADDLIAWYQTLCTRYRSAEVVYIDPSATWLKNELMMKRVNNILDAENQVLPGIGSVSSLFSLNKLAISSECTGLLSEINAYSWDEKKFEGGTDKPKDGNDHSMDALRYAVHSSRHRWERALGMKVYGRK